MFNKETEMYEGYIYEIYNPLNTKSYIGQTIRTVEQRWKRHISTSKRTIEIYFYEDLRTYGEDIFNVYTLEKVECGSLEELHKKLDNLEMYYIKHKNSIVPNGYNISQGGSCPPINNKGTIYQFDFRGNLLNSYDNSSIASEMSGANAAGIVGCCNGKNFHSGGYCWSRSPVLDNRVLDFVLRLIVVKYDFSGNKIEEYQTTKEASLATGIPSWNITACCRGDQLSAGGYVWRHGDKSFDSFKTPSEINRLCKRVVCVENGIVFNSMIDAGEYAEVSPSRISTVCSNGRAANGLHFKQVV